MAMAVLRDYSGVKHMLLLSDSLPNSTITSLDRNFPQASKVRTVHSVLTSPRGLSLSPSSLIARTLNRTYPLLDRETSHLVQGQRHL